MAVCGYVCAVCEGNGFESQTLLTCAYCASEIQNKIQTTEKSTLENKCTEEVYWIESVHNQCNCGDL